eukprot:scaffold132099_cov61-Attheya_sp.AAC.1
MHIWHEVPKVAVGRGSDDCEKTKYFRPQSQSLECNKNGQWECALCYTATAVGASVLDMDEC